MAGWTGLLRLGAFEIVRLVWVVRESETVSVRRLRFTEGGLSKLVLLVAFGTRALSALRVCTGAVGVSSGIPSKACASRNASSISVASVFA